MISRWIAAALFCAACGSLTLNVEAQREGHPATERNVLRVSGSGEAKASPDVAYVTVGVITEGKRAQEAAQANANLTQKVMDALRGRGIAEKDIQTSNYSVQPRYEDRPGRPPVIAGYQVSNQVRATVRKLDSVGSVIDAALDAGANNVQDVYFGLEAREKAEAEALTKAVQDARRKAETLAKAAGVRVVSVLQIQEGGFVRPVPILDARMEMVKAAGAATPVAPGELTVSANVMMVFETAPGMASTQTRQMARLATQRELLIRLLTKRVILQGQLQSYRQRYSDRHPSVIELKRRIEGLDQQITRTRKGEE